MGGHWKKMIALLLAVCTFLGLTACDGKAAEEQLSGTVYVPEFMEFDLSEWGIEYINTGCCDGTYVYILADVGKESRKLTLRQGKLI